MIEIPSKIREAYRDLPSGWKLEKLKFFAVVRNSNVDKAISEDEKLVRLCNYTDVYYNDRITPGLQFLVGSATEAEIERFQLKQDQVIITKDSEGWDDIGVPAFVTEDMPDVLCGYHLSVIEPGPKLNGGFLAWLCRAEPLNAQFKLAANGVTRFGLGQYPMKNAFIALPPLDTQRRIARFLDKKVARIDGLIAKKRELLNRLSEKRQAIIARAVTTGLNSHVTFKSTGIDRLGSIPAHWEVRRIKEVGKLIGGAGFPHEYQGQRDLELPFFKVIDLSRVSLCQKMIEAENSVDRSTAGLLGASVIKPGDVVFAKVGAALLLNRFRSIGVSCCIDNNMMAFRPSRGISSEFALLAFSTIDFSNIVNPGAVPSISGSQVGHVEIALPHLEEQIEIVESLGQRFEKIESVEKQVANSQRLIEQYRGALITSAVTGRLAELR